MLLFVMLRPLQSMPTLRIHLPDKTELIHEIFGDHVTVGRRPDNTIQIIDRSVSAHHAEFIFVDGHYRMHDLQSTNSTFVEGAAVTDYHLLSACKIAFGTIQCEFDPHANAHHRLSPSQMEKDAAFLKGENAELQAKIQALERRIEIFNSARLVTGRSETNPAAASQDALRAVATERDDLRHQNTGLKLELEMLREELAFTTRQRDEARKQSEIMQAERAMMDREGAEATSQIGRNGRNQNEIEFRPANGACDSEVSHYVNSPLAASGNSQAPPIANGGKSNGRHAGEALAIADAATTQRIVPEAGAA